jgi:uncharacterized membrane protein (UPF0127 family)
MKYLSFVIYLWLFSLIFTTSVGAIYDPLSVSNNQIGVHILDPFEIGEAARLVNNEGQAEWGYVTVPIQATDRNREKWSLFMKKCKELKIIPIIRIATFGEGDSWVEPESLDLTDFANFLNDLPWPTQNRYIIVFNEVNRADEYGGDLSPERYTDILNHAIDVFKSRSDKFFIMPAGLDNAAPNNEIFMRWDTYLNRMYQHNKEIFNRIDGWVSHSYPNPGFQATSAASGDNKIDSFKYDLKLLNKFTGKKLPIFITETGWSSYKVMPETIADMYNHAFLNAWSDDQIVAVTPFLLRAGAPPFDQFSLIGKDNQPTLAYKTIQTFASKGSPEIEPEPTPTKAAKIPDTIALVQGASDDRLANKPNIFQRIIVFFNSLFKQEKNAIVVGNKTYKTEIVTSMMDQAVGLSKYDSLSADQGMLFPFKPAKRAHFWMKNMKFDIDIVWIKDNKVIGVTQGLYADEEKILPSPDVVDFVFEVNINSGIKEGDSVIINQ